MEMKRVYTVSDHHESLLAACHLQRKAETLTPIAPLQQKGLRESPETLKTLGQHRINFLLPKVLVSHEPQHSRYDE